MVGTLFVLYLLLPGFRSFAQEAWEVLGSRDQGRIEEWIRGFGTWGLALIIGLLIVQPFLLVVPSTLMMLVAVLAYGPFWGSLLAWGGSMGAAILAYGIGRALGPATVGKLIGGGTRQKVESYVNEYGVWAVILFRVSPVLSTDAVSFVAGLSDMRFFRYVTATAIGFLPLTALIAFLGTDFGRLEQGLIWVSLASVVVFVGYVAYDRYRT